MGVPGRGGTASVCILPEQLGLGGPNSFQSRLKRGLAERGIPCHHNPYDPTCAALLIIGGTSHVFPVWRAQRRGVRIVQRLDGMNWVHRERRTGWRHFLRAERNNFLLDFIRTRLADAVVYQSRFVQDWWQNARGKGRGWAEVIYNAVDLRDYSPDGPETRPADLWRVQVTEGHIKGGNEKGLEIAVRLNQMMNTPEQPVELVIAGDVARDVQARLDGMGGTRLRWEGVVPREAIPALNRSAHALFSAEINPPCPNSVIEAMACGLPVAGYATGSLPELVSGGAGVLAPYGGDPWRLDEPNYPAMLAALGEIFARQDAFRAAARARAEANFDANDMVAHYVDALLG